MKARKQALILSEKRKIINSALNAIRFNREISFRAETKKTSLSRPTVTDVILRVKAVPELFDNVDMMPDSNLVALLKSTPAPVKVKATPDYIKLIKFMHGNNVLKNEAYLAYCEQCKEKGLTPICLSGFYAGFSVFETKRAPAMMFNYKPGEVTFVDFAGKRPSIKCPLTGELTKVELFVAVLGHSNWLFSHACMTQTVDDWLACHREMFGTMGGVTEYIVPDNLKAAVSRPGKSFVLNRRYQEMAVHYGTHIEPARGYKPKDKARAEGAVRHAYEFVLRKLRNQVFFSLEELNAAIKLLVVQFNARTFRRFNASRQGWYEQREKPALSKLPVLPYIPKSEPRYRKISNNYHIEVRGHWYSVPHELIGEKVTYCESATHLFVSFNNCPVAEHCLSTEVGGMTTHQVHMPASHRAYASLSKPNLLKWANRIGPNSTELINAQFRNKPDGAPSIKKRCGEFKSLADKFGDSAFEDAAESALMHSATSLRFFKLAIAKSSQTNALH